MSKLLWKKAISVTLSAALLVTSLQTGNLGSMTAQAAQTENETADSSIIKLQGESQMGTYRADLAYNRVGVHDPSVIQDPKTGRYYIFGSHCAWAWSDDLENWTSFTNNITEGDNGSAHTIFKDEIAWCKKANANYTVTGNLWAPDIIWNETMGKWCMYMSINGPKWNSTISLLTADSLDGNWTYVGPVIQSGMSNGFGATFDYEKVMGNTDVSRFTSSLSGGGNPTIEAHAIDACVIYDDDGNLWMTYGSWSGGISMIQLDKETGLRNYNVTYPNTNNAVDANGLISDPYTGYKIAGGTAVSGEGSYLQKIGDYYYLFLSYGAYAPEGGYNMRIFRSSDVKGPYKDVLGNDARTVVNGNAGKEKGSTGMRLMSYYKWNFAEYGYTAQGHNSAIVDKDSGKAFVIYHNKYNDGTAAHEVRVHQLLMNEDGWILAAPFEYADETVSETGYAQELFTGSYSIMFQKQNVNHESLECSTEENIKLGAGTEVKNDSGEVTGYTGKITGDYTGTWTSTKDTPYISLAIGNNTYKGVLCEGTIDETDVKAMTFTAVGSTNQECLWGYKTKDPSVAIKMTIDKQITFPDTVVTDMELPAVGVGGSTITWKSNSIAISDDGKVFYQKADMPASLTAIITNNGYQYEKTYTFTVPGSDTLSQDSEVVLKKFYTDTELDLSKLTQGNTPSFINPFYYTHEDISKGATISFDVTRTANSDRLSNIISLNNKLGKLYFTGGSYLGYNDFNDHYFDANLKSGYVAGTDYLATNKKVTIKIEITSTGVTVYKDGTEAYSTATLKAKETDGGYSDNNPETTTLDWLKTAPELNFGSGNFWNDLIFKGKVSNVIFAYKQPAIEVNGSSGSSSSSGLTGLYTQDYENVKDKKDVFESGSLSGGISIAGGEENKYLQFQQDGSSGNRGGMTVFDNAVTSIENYEVELDLAVTSGNVADRSQSQFVLTGTDTTTTNGNNNGTDAGYILKLSTGPNSTTWTINDSDQTVEIPKDTWVHIKVVVSTATNGTKTVQLQIKNGNQNLYNGNVSVNGKGYLKGMYILSGRGSGLTKVDNIVVKEQGKDYVDLSNYKLALERAKKFVEIQTATHYFTEESYTALTSAIQTAEGKVTTGITSEQQSMVNEQAAALKTAVEGLVYKTCKVTILSTMVNGNVTGLATNGEYQAGTPIILTAVPSDGYALDKWVDDAGNVLSVQETYTAIVTKDISIAPVFKELKEPDTPKPVTIKYKTALKLKDIELPEGWTWNVPTTTLQNIETKEYAVTYTTTDPFMYKNVTGRKVEVIVEKGDPSYQSVPDLQGVLGEKLSTVILPTDTNGTWAWKEPDTVLEGTLSESKKYTAEFTPKDNTHYNSVTCEITVVLKNPSTESTEPVEPDAPEGITVTYTPTLTLQDVTLPDDWSWDAPTTKLSNIGTKKYPASYTSTDPEMYKDATAEIEVTVEKAIPTYAEVSGLNGILGQTLSTVTLPKDVNGTWAWKAPDTEMTNSTNKFDAIFTPTDSEHYNTVECKIEVTIKTESGDVVIITPETPTLEAVTYEFGLVLGNVTLPADWKWQDSNTELSAGTRDYDAIYIPNQDAVKITLTVLKNTNPNYAIVQNLKGKEGDKLNTITLPEQWQWKNPNQTLSLQESKYPAIFTHSSGNYEDIEVMVDIAVTAKSVTDNTGGSSTDKDKDVNTNTDKDKNQNGSGTTNKKDTVKQMQGKTYTVGGIQYKVTSAASKTVSIVGLSKSAKKKKSITIKKTVKINKVTFTITEIGNSAFASCKKLKKVTIGANVTKIGKKAFYKCSKLKNITIQSKKLKSVGKKALQGIYKKAVIKVPKSKLKAYKKLLKKKGQSSKVKIKK